MDDATAAAASVVPKNNTSFTEDSDLRVKLAQAASLLSHESSASPIPSQSQLQPKDLGSSVSQQPQPQPQQQPSQTHGYAQSRVDPQTHIHPNLRAAVSIAPAPDIMPAGIAPSSEQPGAVRATSSAMAVHGLLDHDPEESVTDGRKAKRELSQSKRAAQNRAAQRAFRQRKEHYIKKLEQQVREYSDMEHEYKAVRNDNYALREYVIQLQSRLLDLQVEPPQPPPNINISLPAATTSRSAPSSNIPEPSTSTAPAGSLADVAAAVAGLRARERSADGLYGKTPMKEEGEPRSENDMRRQLQQHDTLPPPSSLRV